MTQASARGARDNTPPRFGLLLRSTNLLGTSVIVLELVARDHLHLVSFSLDRVGSKGPLPGNLVGPQPSFVQLAAPLLEQGGVIAQDLVSHLELLVSNLLVVPLLHLVSAQTLDAD